MPTVHTPYGAKEVQIRDDLHLATIANAIDDASSFD